MRGILWTPGIAVVLLAGASWGCGEDGNGPMQPGGPAAGEVTATLTDPAGDTWGNRGTQWDLTSMTVSRDTAGVTVRLSFTSLLVAPTSGDANAMIGFIDFDTDGDSTSGGSTTTDEFRRDGGHTGIDSDFRVALADYAADSSVTVFDASGTVMGHVTPVFSGNQVTVRIPRALLGNDDGFLNATALVGTTASPTDFAPETGHLTLAPPGS